MLFLLATGFLCFSLGVFHVGQVFHDCVEMSHILYQGKPRKRLTTSLVWTICRDHPDNLYKTIAGNTNHWPTTDTMNSDPIDKVVHPLSGADATGEEAKSSALHTGEAKPSNLLSDREEGISWEERYEMLWYIKLRLWPPNDD